MAVATATTGPLHHQPQQEQQGAGRVTPPSPAGEGNEGSLGGLSPSASAATLMLAEGEPSFSVRRARSECLVFAMGKASADIVMHHGAAEAQGGGTSGPRKLIVVGCAREFRAEVSQALPPQSRVTMKTTRH